LVSSASRKKSRMRKPFAFLTVLIFAISLLASNAFSNSTIDPTQPPTGSPFVSAPVRNNFVAAFNDINNILGQFAGPNPPANPNAGQFWRNTSATPNIVNQWSGTAWLQVATFDAIGGTITPFVGNTLLAWQQLVPGLGTSGKCLVFTGASTVPTAQNCLNGATLGTGVLTALGNGVNTSGGLVTFSGVAGSITFSGLPEFNFNSGTGAGAFYDSSTTANRFFVGSDATADEWRVFSTGAGQLLTLNGATGAAVISGPVQLPSLASSSTNCVTASPSGQLAVSTCLSGGTSGNPTALVGSTAVNGTATTFMPSDAAPALNLASANTWTNTITISPPAASTTQGILVNQSAPTSGTASGVSSPCWIGGQPAVVFNYRCVNGEALNGSSGPTFVIADSVGLITGGSNSNGGKYAFNVSLQTNAASNPSTPRDRVSFTATAFDAFGEGGTNTGGGAKGDLFASQFGAHLNSGATNLFSISAAEVDIGINSGASAANRLGWSIVDNGQIQAASLDTAFEISAAAGAPGFKTGILFSSLHGAPGVSGNLLGTDGAPATIGRILDFESYSIIGAAIQIFNQHATAGDFGMVLGVGLNTATDTSSVYAQFVNPADNIQAGIIARADAAGVAHVTYSTASDERLKRHIGYLDDSLARLDRIELHKYQGAEYTGDDWTFGYFAQNLATAAPWCVTISKDPDFKRHPSQVDYGCMSAFNTDVAKREQAEIVELQKRITILEQRVIAAMPGGAMPAMPSK
jgi:hypothetical protein